MASRQENALKAVLTLLLIASAGALAVSSFFYNAGLVRPFFAASLASVALVHFRVRPEWSDALLVLACMLAFAVVDFRILHYTPAAVAWISFFGLGSFLVLAIRAVWAPPAERKLLNYAWIPLVFSVGTGCLAPALFTYMDAAHPKTLDLYLLSFDLSLRVQWSFLAGQLFAHRAWLHIIGFLFYIALPIPIALVYGGQLVRIKEKSFPVVLAFIVTSPLGALFYNLFPACGPIFLFKQAFPFRPFPIADVPRLVLESVAIQGPRNAIPSLHVAWTLLAWWYSRGLSWWERSIAFTFLAFTLLSTLGTGEHWFIDLIVAFPFALMVQAFCAYSLSWKDARRIAPFLFGLLLTLAWFATLRYTPKLFWTSPVVPWALVLGTVALTLIRQEKFAHASEESQGFFSAGNRPAVASEKGPAGASSDVEAGVVASGSSVV